ncbi:STM3941 family protein [Methylopila sp. M107]|uniref:STM3941 family protein n=1 Tax=Methylopila sp. M107 TaxID=1101190 RepID=UPI00036E322D|nr:STM3941 family protein [Methylopila sp. M107]
MSDEQVDLEKPIDIEKSWARSLALFAGAWAFVAVGALLLYLRPKGLEPGSFNEFSAYGCIAFFALCGVIAGVRMLRTGPVVSVGPAGIFDRRLSTDWIPWEAIPRVGFVTMRKQQMLVLEPAPGVEAALPLRR